MTMKRFPHLTLFTFALSLLSGCVHAQIVQNITPHDTQPVQSVITTVDPTGSCSNYAQLYINWKTGIQTACVNGTYVSSSVGGGGTQGPQGPQGATGPTGATGPAGAAATITVGTTTTGAAGTNASVTNSGTSSAAVFNFTIPRGADGTGGGGTGPFGLYTTAASGTGTQTVGSDCSTGTPCAARIGTTVAKTTATASFTVPSGSSSNDTAFIYIDPSNEQLTVGDQTLVLTCTGCTAVTGITAFPFGSIPLYTATITSGNVASVTDNRAPYSAPAPLVAGTCIVLTPGSSSTTVAVDTTNASCTGGGGSAFNGGTITAPMTISTSGAGATDNFLSKITSSTGYNAIALQDDLGNEWQMALGGTAAGGLAYDSALYFYDKKNTNAFFTVNPATDQVTMKASGTNSSPLKLTSSNTNATDFTIENTSTGGHSFNLSSGGSGGTAGEFSVYDSTSNKVYFAINANNSAIQLIQTGMLAWAADANWATNNAIDSKIVRVNSGELAIENGSSAWGTVDASTVRASTTISTHNTANTDVAGQVTLASGTATYTFGATYANAPTCVATDTTATNAVKVSATTTVLTLTGTGTDVLNYICISHN